jgi:hypothetical protein
MKPLLSTCAAFALASALYAPAALAQPAPLPPPPAPAARPTVVTPRQEALGLPSGPYLMGCTGSHVVNGSLVALCDDRTTATQDAMDTWHTAQMPLAAAQQCNGAVVDLRNGRLACGTPAMVAARIEPLLYGTGVGVAGQTPMVGSSAAPQYYGSGFGTSAPPYGSSGAPAYNPYTLPPATRAPASSGGVPGYHG